MRKLIIILLLATSCSPKIVERVNVVEKQVLKDTTIFVEVTKEVQKNIVKDTISTLENKFAKTTAIIDEKGYLNHTLEQKDVKLPFKIKYIDKVRDSIIERPIYIKGDKVTKEVVPTWCWILLAVFVICVGFRARKLFI